MKWILWVLVALALVLSAVLYQRLPQELPVHWNMAGEVDRYDSKQTAAFLLPLIMAIIAAIFEAIPRISPSGFTVESNSRGLRAIGIATLLLMLAIHATTLFAALGAKIDMNRVMPIMVGVLFLVIGNYMSTVRKNFFVGIRTPWTLANDDVWFRTHRLGGRLFMLGGVVLMVTAFFPPAVMVPALFTVIAVAAGVPFVYSYVVYRRIAAEK